MTGVDVGTDVRLQVDGLAVHFGGVVALRDVSMTVAAGEMVGLIGANGAGKSTLFDVLSGFVPPDSGRVQLDGEDITSRSATWRARHGLRRTFQRQQVFGHLSVRDNILAALDCEVGLGRLLREAVASDPLSSDPERRERVTDALSICGLVARSADLAAHLAIGDIRMLELARAIVSRPRVLLLDEPTSGLDDVEKDRLADAVSAQRDSTDCAVVLVEHDIEFVMQQCERVLVLHLGELIADGSPDAVAADPAVHAAYLL